MANLVPLTDLVGRINAEHEAGLRSIAGALEYAISVGKLLVEAKAQIKHGEWLPWVEENCAFDRTQAFRYMKAWKHRDEIRANVAHAQQMSIRSALKMLAAPEDEPALENIEGCTGADLWGLVERGLHFGTVYADPPWPYTNQGTRSATHNFYETLTIEEITALPVPELSAGKAHLHLWTTNAFLPEASKLMADWGFEYKGMYVWVKPQMGIGNYWRVSHELLLLGVRGGLTFPESVKSWGEYNRTKHSEKPEAVRLLIEKVSPAPRLELFGRRAAPDWLVWGNQITRNLFTAGIPEAAP